MEYKKSIKKGYKVFYIAAFQKITDWFLKNQHDQTMLPPSFHTSRHSIVWKVKADDDREYFIKRFRPEGFPDRLKDSIRGSRAICAWKAGIMLERAGFKVPVVVSLGEKRRIGLVTDAFLITLPIKGVSLLDLLIPVTSFKIKRDIIRQIGKEIGRLHRQAIIHGDLIPGNIFACEEKGRYSLCFLDNERTRKTSTLPMLERIKNLVQLNRVIVPRITATDRVRFLDAYLEENSDLREKRNELLRKIGEITSERVMRHRGIPVEKRNFTTFRAVMAWKEGN